MKGTFHILAGDEVIYTSNEVITADEFMLQVSSYFEKFRERKADVSIDDYYVENYLNSEDVKVTEERLAEILSPDNIKQIEDAGWFIVNQTIDRIILEKLPRYKQEDLEEDLMKGYRSGLDGEDD